jgi:hypothetical protein
MADTLPVSLPLLLPLAGAMAVVVVLLFAGKVPVSYNLRNLLVRWRITIVTALAFTLVVGLMTVMLAFVNGMYRLTKGSGRPTNVIILSDGATDELFSAISFDEAGDVLNRIAPDLRPTLRPDERGGTLVSKEVYIVVGQPIPGGPVGGMRRRFVQLRGVEDPVASAAAHGLTLLEGAWFSEAGVQEVRERTDSGYERETAIQVVLGEGIARELGPDQGKESLHVNDVFEMGPNQEAGDSRARKWIVVGIMKSAGSTFASEVWAKHGVAGKMFGKEGYTALVLPTRDAESAQAVARDIRERVKLKAEPESEYYANLSETNKQFFYAVVFVAIIMAIGGVFGVMNTMFAAISQRTKDIGVLRILGYRRWEILVSFFLESLGIALLGGILGCALGYLADGRTATSMVSSGEGSGKSVILRMVVDGDILAAGLLFTLAMGALGGLVPALSAMRLRALESLR